MRVTIYGAGVIGQIYGARLTRAGHEVRLVARGANAARLAEHGVQLADADGSNAWQVRPSVVAESSVGTADDLTLVTVRRDQVGALLPRLAEQTTGRVVFLLNPPTDLAQIRQQIGAERTAFAFPGVGGYRAPDGTIRYLQLAQQPTTVEQREGLTEPTVDLLRSAQFPVAVTTQMAGWLTTHAVFIAGVGAAILAKDGDSAALASDRPVMRQLVTAVGEGFRALRRTGVAVTPTPLRLIFTAVPRPIAVRYWSRQLSGPLGAVAIAPHVRATRQTEFRQLCADVRGLVADGGPTPGLDRLLDATS